MHITKHLWVELGKNSYGIAIGPILFVVGLLGILAAAIAAGSGSFSGSTSSEAARANATTILEYAHTVQTGIDLIRGRGCDDSQISFYFPGLSGYSAAPYTNSNAPADNSCHVFDIAGGGVLGGPILLPASAF